MEINLKGKSLIDKKNHRVLRDDYQGIEFKTFEQLSNIIDIIVNNIDPIFIGEDVITTICNYSYNEMYKIKIVKNILTIQIFIKKLYKLQEALDIFLIQLDFKNFQEISEFIMTLSVSKAILSLKVKNRYDARFC